MFGKRALQLDRKIFDKLAEAHHPALDRTAFSLSNAANHSKIWLLIAAGLAVGGGHSGRRAALRGFLALCLTSATVNIPAKRLIRRKRPVTKSQLKIGRLTKEPSINSFPSSHAASAAAFATGVGLEKPLLATPLGILAGAVGVSRVYAGVHYPLDVAAGALLGFVAGMSTKRLLSQGVSPKKSSFRVR